MSDKLIDLKNRHVLCTLAIRTLQDSPEDPRQPEALAHYQAQSDELNRLIAAEESAERARLGQPDPAPVIIGLQAAQLFARTQKES